MMSTQQREAIRAARQRDIRSVNARRCYSGVITALSHAGVGHLLTMKPLPAQRIERALEMLAVGGPESPRAAVLQDLLTRKPVRYAKVPQAFLAYLRRHPEFVRSVIASATGRAQPT